MKRNSKQPKSGTKAYRDWYAKRNHDTLNAQARSRMSKYRERMDVAVRVVGNCIDRLTEKSRRSLGSLTGRELRMASLRIANSEFDRISDHGQRALKAVGVKVEKTATKKKTSRRKAA